MKISTKNLYTKTVLTLTAIIAVITLTTPPTFAQNGKLDVIVRSGDDGKTPLYFSYIKHHNKTVAVTDTLGLATLENIAIGDTITASYVGMSPSKSVYEGQKVMELFLSDIEGTNTRQVHAKYDVMKVYKQNTLKMGASYNSMQNYLTTARVKINILRNGKYQRVTGNVKYRGWLSFNINKLKKGVEMQTEFETKDDTTGVWDYIQIATIGAIECANAAVIGQFAVRHEFMPVGVQYLGVKKNNKLFRFNIDAAKLASAHSDEISKHTPDEINPTISKEMQMLKNLKLQLIGHFNEKKAPVLFNVAATADSVDMSLNASFRLDGKKLFIFHKLELTALESEIRMSNGDYMTIEFSNIQLKKSRYKIKKK